VRLGGVTAPEMGIVTLFVIVTAVLNIAVGYALAIYVDQAKWPFRRRSAEVDPLAHLDEFSLASIGSATVEALPTAPPTADASVAPTAVESAQAAPGSPADTPSASDEGVEMERDVLAGIEEFRNQLAQMKASPAVPEVAASV
jgi:hypothetical protein